MFVLSVVTWGFVYTLGLGFLGTLRFSSQNGSVRACVYHKTKLGRRSELGEKSILLLRQMLFFRVGERERAKEERRKMDGRGIIQ